ncbi:phosphatase PAP2 family protein [Thiorhodovibrio frisius]|uniref:undecaprenyl-diphosphate phosphatase n=1 Tax=Thiorhodovibrio frisius TaxID=631362 RepID=H8Z8A6_9GAMM|nr:phosphatase PAP2 family protein [Thiorhodovibrio frisius]EIC21055.1 membrane-associated phospholipid phosphatase [Thiorhodovibrio frisius]WPL22115.1 undecaprenyl pyrophosphate phosphatase [Thiorhodovibrio frisius]
MAEGLLGFLGRDLKTALQRGLEVDPSTNPDAARELLLAVLALALLALGLFLMGGYHAGFGTVNAWSRDYPSWLWQNLTLLGDEHLAFALALFFARRHPRVFWVLICAALVGAAYARGLKPLVDALRPPAVLESGSFQLIGPGHRHHSFPSGHGVTAGVFFGVLIYHARRGKWRLLFLLLALLAGLSRVALGVHWPVDVAAGLAGGLLAAWLGVGLARRLPWGITDTSIHLAMVTLAVIMAVALALAGRGYPDALWPGRVVVGLALLSALLSYLVLPVMRYVRERWRGDGAGG